jgi:hypothetical protein
VAKTNPHPTKTTGPAKGAPGTVTQGGKIRPTRTKSGQKTNA